VGPFSGGTSTEGSSTKAPQHPLEQNYGVSLAIAILALVPFIIITTAFELFQKSVGHDVGIDKNGLAVISAMSTAGYAFGALLGGDIIQRFPQRKLFFSAETASVVGCLLSATSFGMVQFGAGMVLLAFATGLLLVMYGWLNPTYPASECSDGFRHDWPPCERRWIRLHKGPTPRLGAAEDCVPDVRIITLPLEERAKIFGCRLQVPRLIFAVWFFLKLVGAIGFEKARGGRNVHRLVRVC